MILEVLLLQHGTLCQYHNPFHDDELPTSFHRHVNTELFHKAYDHPPACSWLCFSVTAGKYKFTEWLSEWVGEWPLLILRHMIHIPAQVYTTYYNMYTNCLITVKSSRKDSHATFIQQTMCYITLLLHYITFLVGLLWQVHWFWKLQNLSAGAGLMLLSFFILPLLERKGNEIVWYTDYS